MIVITNQQLITTNLIFAEHKKLLKSDSLLNREIDNYKSIIKINETQDSIQRIQIKECMDKIENDSKEIATLQKQVKKKTFWSRIQNGVIGLLGAGLACFVITTL